jgi:hypothetical protein
MDTQSRNVIGFLEALGSEMGRFTGEVKSQYADRQGGRMARMPVLGVTSGSLTLALPVRGSDGVEYELGVDVTWDSERWTIASGLYRDSDKGGQETLRQLPERSASDLESCLEHVHAAVSDLARYDDLIP